MADTTEEPFFSDRLLRGTTKQEIADCVIYVNKLRVLRKLGGFGSIEFVLKDGVVQKCMLREETHYKG